MKTFAFIVTLLVSSAAAAQVLPSWNDGAAKQGIVEFVKAVTAKGGKELVRPADSIAVFDNDGTLWSEQPLYFQFVFMLDQVKASGGPMPDPHDQKALLAAMGKATSGMTVAEYDRKIRDWLAKERHPKFKRPYTDLVYKPMQELLAYLRANGFKTFIVSGGSVEFMRPWAEKAYGIPPEQVVGSSGKIKYEMTAGRPALMRLAEVDFIDDGAGKPVGILRHIGRRPIFAFGNSDGDLEMLQWTAAGAGARFCLFVHHDDAKREWAYDRDSKIGRLDKELDEAKVHGWTVTSMKDDWKTVYVGAR